MSRRDASTTKVFVGSLPPGVTTDHLRKLFAPYGNIVECDIANRCGFLHLEDRELAMKAIEELNNTNFMGGRISVEKGRVKAPFRGRGRDGAGPMRGGRDRGGPYARDDGYGRGPPRNGNYPATRGYSEYDRYDYARGMPPREYGSEYNMGDRRPMYDDRRGYMNDRRGQYVPPNGYEYESYDTPYPSYDSRPEDTANYDDRRQIMTDRRPLLDQQAAEADVPRPLSSFDRTVPPSTDMYSRRADGATKPSATYSERDPMGAAYGTTSASNVPGYSTVGGYNSGAGMPAAAYGGTAAAGYGTTTAGYGTAAAYTDNRSVPAMTGGYGDTRSAGMVPATYGSIPPVTSGYATGPAAPSAYNSATGAYGDTYGATRGDNYDTSYPLPPQRR